MSDVAERLRQWADDHYAHGDRVAEVTVKDLHALLRKRDAAVAQRDALREAIGTDDDVEAYLRALPWTPEDTDRDRTLVAGNIRTFHAWIQDRAGIGGGS